LRRTLVLIQPYSTRSGWQVSLLICIPRLNEKGDCRYKEISAGKPNRSSLALRLFIKFLHKNCILFCKVVTLGQQFAIDKKTYTSLINKVFFTNHLTLT
jgi:hypothetical protein